MGPVLGTVSFMKIVGVRVMLVRNCTISMNHHDGQFAVVGLGRQKVFGDIVQDYPDDPVFQFQYRSPDMLSAALWHAQGDGPFRFHELSEMLFQRITAWLGSAPKAESCVREIKEVAV